MSLRPAVFLDRDGVLNTVVMRDGIPASPRLLDEFTLEPDTHTSLGHLDTAGFLLFSVTNQPDIRRGLLEPGVLAAMSARLLAELPLREAIACPHDDRDGCDCRKPRPGMLLALAKRWPVDLHRSFMIGDQDRDMQCGRAAGCRTIQLEKTYNTGAGADWRVPDLATAVAIILGTVRSRR